MHKNNSQKLKFVDEVCFCLQVEWLMCWTPNKAVLTRALSGVIAVSSLRVRILTLSVLSILDRLNRAVAQFSLSAI